MSPRRLDRRSMAVLAAGHFSVDLCQGAVPALLPFFVADRGYSIAAVSALVLAATLSSSIVQPLFGLSSDRRSLPWLMPGGVALASAGIAACGLMTSYPATFGAIVLSGLGVAAFHPEGSRFATYVSGARRGAGMSFFSLGGNAGYAAGPLVTTPAVIAFGLGGTLVAAILPALVAVVVATQLPWLLRQRPPSGRAPIAAHDDRPDAWGPFARLTLAVCVRSVVYFGLATLVPLYFVRRLGTSEALANAALTAMLAGGVCGTLVGGQLADRVGARAVFVASMALLTPLLGAFLLAGPGIAIALIALVGAATIATFSVTVVIAHELLPGRIGVASGIVMGFAIGIGGVAAAGLGVLAEATSLRTVIALIAVLPLLGLALALTLPRRRLTHVVAALPEATPVEGIA